MTIPDPPADPVRFANESIQLRAASMNPESHDSKTGNSSEESGILSWMNMRLDTGSRESVAPAVPARRQTRLRLPTVIGHGTSSWLCRSLVRVCTKAFTAA